MLQIYTVALKIIWPLDFLTFDHISGLKHKKISNEILWRINTKWDAAVNWNEIHAIF